MIFDGGLGTSLLNLGCLKVNIMIQSVTLLFQFKPDKLPDCLDSPCNGHMLIFKII